MRALFSESQHGGDSLTLLPSLVSVEQGSTRGQTLVGSSNIGIKLDQAVVFLDVRDVGVFAANSSEVEVISLVVSSGGRWRRSGNCRLSIAGGRFLRSSASTALHGCTAGESLLELCGNLSVSFGKGGFV